MKAFSKAQGGLLVALVGAVFLYGSRDFNVGVPRNMGPGMFPVVLSLLTILSGLTIAVFDILRFVAPEGRFPWTALAAVATAIALYALLIERAGIAITTFLAIAVLSLAIPNMKWRETIVLAFGLSIFLWLTFVLGLGMPLHLLPEL
ncbi:tripartite tricarboxylate transporter TctB family protein [uncultured Aliiroseovarius sp.]|uniref:tripartite tricarboxylate transporter TctB family protein n=1 Tax=uncultured Aliiroseovarius sp. TaxID=1658783 RepID=UPI0025996588|nr:tripartite tricarboxylate transporter TctB family protein [uncultured Aliiroseovarius sp.]